MFNHRMARLWFHTTARKQFLTKQKRPNNDIGWSYQNTNRNRNKTKINAETNIATFDVMQCIEWSDQIKNGVLQTRTHYAHMKFTFHQTMVIAISIGQYLSFKEMVDIVPFFELSSISNMMPHYWSFDHTLRIHCWLIDGRLNACMHAFPEHVNKFSSYVYRRIKVSSTHPTILGVNASCTHIILPEHRAQPWRVAK